MPQHALRILATILLGVVGFAGCSFGGNSGSESESPIVVSEMPPATSTVPPTPLTLLVDTPTPPPAATATPSPPPAPTLEPSPIVIQSTLVSTIDTFLASEPGMFGVVILDGNGQYLYARNADIPFIAASLYKLVLLANIYARIESGELGLDMTLPLLPEYFDDQFAAEDGFYLLDDVGGETSLETALYGAGAYSSNIAAQVLMSLTSTESLRATAESLGMWDTWFNVVPAEDIPNWPNRYLGSGNPVASEAIAFIDEQAQYNLLHMTTPNDIARYWRLLLDGQVVSADASAAILAILSDQVVTDRIPYLLPDGYSTANKTGNLYHVVHDSGTIAGPSGSVIIAALSQNEPDDDHGAQVIQRVALAAIGETELPPFTASHFDLPGEEATPDESQA